MAVKVVLSEAPGLGVELDRDALAALAANYRTSGIRVRDDTAEIVKRDFASVRLVRKANGGPGSARNRGVDEARLERRPLGDEFREVARDVILASRAATGLA